MVADSRRFACASDRFNKLVPRFFSFEIFTSFLTHDRWKTVHNLFVNKLGLNKQQFAIIGISKLFFVSSVKLTDASCLYDLNSFF